MPGLTTVPVPSTMPMLSTMATNEVRCVYKNIGYTLRSHEYDGTQPGRFNACHAER
jgi:hypothetical protein